MESIRTSQREQLGPENSVKRGIRGIREAMRYQIRDSSTPVIRQSVGIYGSWQVLPVVAWAWRDVYTHT